jgi:DNA-directed RNA polymerase I, II, and III subunit RPABC2
MQSQFIFDFGNDEQKPMNIDDEEGGENDVGVYCSEEDEFDRESLNSHDSCALRTSRTSRTSFKQRETRNIMTKYEWTGIIGARGTLLAKGAPPYVDTQGESDPNKIARLELLAKKIPVVVRRYLPNDQYEDWSLHELDIEAFK